MPTQGEWAIPLQPVRSVESATQKACLFETERTAIVSGPTENVIYALPTVRALGVNHLVLNIRLLAERTEDLFSLHQANQLAALLIAQNYVRKVSIVHCDIKLEEVYAIPGILYNLDHYRNVDPRTLPPTPESGPGETKNGELLHRAQWLAEAQGINISVDESWLDAPKNEQAKNAVVLGLERTRFPRWYWAYLLRGLPKTFFVGAEKDFSDAKIPNATYFRSANYLDLACLLAGSHLFLGTAGLSLAIADGLKIPRIVELPKSSDVYPVGTRAHVFGADVLVTRQHIADYLPDEQAPIYRLITAKLAKNPFFQALRLAFLFRTALVPTCQRALKAAFRRKITDFPKIKLSVRRKTFAKPKV